MRKAFPHIFVGFSFLILVALGTWQVYRLQWKKETMQKVESRLAQEPITSGIFTSVENDEFKTMKVNGIFLNEKEMVLLNKNFNGKQGYHIITPLKTPQDEVILVNRGWTPSDKEPARPDTEQTVTGIIRGSQKLNFIGRNIVIPNTPEKNQWFTVDLKAMYKQVGAPEKPYYLEAIDPEVAIRKVPKSRQSISGEVKPSRETMRQTYPYGLPKEIKIYNEHIQYVITWYSLAAALLIIYYFRFFKKPTNKE